MKLLCLIGILFCLGLTNRAADSKETSDLFGRVLNEEGKAVPKATVFIYTAAPKKGAATLCPSCYADCRKKAQTDADGQFKIVSLDPKLLFRLLVIANGYEARFVPNVDPDLGRTEIDLILRDPVAAHSSSRVEGAVIGPDGRPLAGAVLNIEGLERGSSTRWGGNQNDADVVAVSDDEGRFLVSCKPGINAIHAMAEGPGVAKRWIKLTPGRDHLVRMQEGVSVAGRLMRQGRPVAGAVVGLVTTERMAGVCLHDFEASSAEDGSFAILSVTPGQNYYLFARMESLREQGALPVKTIKTGATGTRLELGPLEVQSGHRIRGQVLLLDGKMIPPQTKLVLSREQAWDHAEVLLDEGGEFEFLGVPSESVSLYVRVNGYRFSKRNPSLDWLNGGIVGRVDSDIVKLRLVLEPGQWRYNRDGEDDMPPDAERQPRDKPLRGVPTR